jgi:hypothetical protein
MAFSSAYCAEELPAFNSTIQRFDARFFSLDFPLTAIATIVASGPDELTVNAEYRSNRDLVGLLWNTRDRYGHPMCQYEEKLDYTGTVLAFVANPPDPYNFTVTFTAGGVSGDATGPLVYRMYPYAVSGSTLVPAVVDPDTNGPGPGTAYAVSTLFPGGLTVPAGYQVYILNFDDLRSGFNYDGTLIPASFIAQLFFSLTPPQFGLGTTAHLRHAGGMFGVAGHPGQVVVLGVETLTDWVIQDVDPNLRLAKGDILRAVVSVPDTAHVGRKSVKYDLHNFNIDILVNTWSGEGTTTRTIRIENDDHMLKDVAFIGGKVIPLKLQRDTPLGSVPIQFSMKNISVTGPGAIIGRRLYPQPAHSLNMTSGFDDTYNITPWRQIDNTYNLGYRGFFTMYMGMSHYFKANATGGYSAFNNQVVKDAAEPLNAPTQAFWASMCSIGHAKGYTFVWSTSYEILSSYMPEDWCQHDYQGKRGLSGWVPPSAFVIPAYRGAGSPIDYLARVIKHGMAITAANGGTDLRFQIGEPWWWDGSYTSGAPAIYDEYTKAKYTTDTGQPVPTPYITDYTTPIVAGSPTEAYLTWLGHELGQSTNYIRDSVKAAYPAAKATLLFFSPQIFAGGTSQNTPGLPPSTTPNNGLLSIINFPINDWKWPNYDFMQIEDYDWIINGDLAKLPFTREAATVTLEYPISVVHYFVGFVLFAKDTYIWPNINIATKGAIVAGLSHIAIWAYPQVIRDGILYDDSLIDNQPAVYPDLPHYRDLTSDPTGNLIRPVFFAQIGDDVFMSTADRNIVTQGKTWQAMSRFGKIDMLTEGITNSESGWMMRLDAVPLAQLEGMAAFLKNDRVVLYVGLVDGGNQLLAPIKSIGSGRVFDNKIDVADGYGSIAVSVRSGLANWSRNNGSRYSQEAQQQKHPGDMGLNFVAGLSQTKVLWGPSK